MGIPKSSKLLDHMSIEIHGCRGFPIAIQLQIQHEVGHLQHGWSIGNIRTRIDPMDYEWFVAKKTIIFQSFPIPFILRIFTSEYLKSPKNVFIATCVAQTCSFLQPEPASLKWGG